MGYTEHKKHNNLYDQQGGTVSERYHLTSEQHGFIDQDVTNGSSPTFGDMFSTTITASFSKVDEIILNTEFDSGNGIIGSFYWSAADGTAVLVLAGGEVHYELGQNAFFYMKNDTASIIPNGTMVMPSGAVGGSTHIAATLFPGDGTVEAYFAAGMTTESIDPGE